MLGDAHNVFHPVRMGCLTSKGTKKNLSCMFCLHFILNASLSLPLMFNSRFLSPRLLSGLQAVYVGITVFISELILRI